jgi:hypothetical protein
MPEPTTIDDALRPLSAEELKEFRPITAAEIDEALEQGRQEAEAFDQRAYARPGYYFCSR